MNKQIKVKLIKSIHGCTEIQKANVRGLGLKKIGQTSTLQNTSCVRGMIKKIIHLVELQE